MRLRPYTTEELRERTTPEEFEAIQTYRGTFRFLWKHSPGAVVVVVLCFLLFLVSIGAAFTMAVAG